MDFTMVTPSKEYLKRRMFGDPMKEDTPEQPPTKNKIIDHEAKEEASRLKQIQKCFFFKTSDVNHSHSKI
jgi:hypothetical protein